MCACKAFECVCIFDLSSLSFSPFFFSLSSSLSLSFLPFLSLSLSFPIATGPILYPSAEAVYRPIPSIPMAPIAITNTTYNTHSYTSTSSISRYHQPPLSHLGAAGGGAGHNSFQYVTTPTSYHQQATSPIHSRPALYNQYTPVQVLQPMPAYLPSGGRQMTAVTGTTTMDQGTGFTGPTDSFSSPSTRHWSPTTYP